MTNSIGSLLSQSRFAEPPEVRTIKEFVFSKFGVTPTVIIREQDIVISVQSAALAGALRMYLHELQNLCDTKKRLVIRIQ